MKNDRTWYDRSVQNILHAMLELQHTFVVHNHNPIFRDEIAIITTATQVDAFRICLDEIGVSYAGKDIIETYYATDKSLFGNFHATPIKSELTSALFIEDAENGYVVRPGATDGLTPGQFMYLIEAVREKLQTKSQIMVIDLNEDGDLDLDAEKVEHIVGLLKSFESMLNDIKRLVYPLYNENDEKLLAAIENRLVKVHENNTLELTEKAYKIFPHLKAENNA